MTPVEFYLSQGWRVTSPYGMRTLEGKYVMHEGIDFGRKPIGEPIRTPYDGVVRASGLYGNAGNAISIKSKQTGLMLLFFHLNTRTVKPGDIVKAGDIIGTNGKTGYSFGEHLHFEIRQDKGILFGSSRPAWGNPAKYSEMSEEELILLKLNVLGKQMELEQVIVKDNQNYVNLRELFEKLNCVVDWRNGQVTIVPK